MKNHQKTFARRLRTREEIKNKVPIFQTKAWEQRKQARAKKLENKLNKIKAKRLK